MGLSVSFLPVLNLSRDAVCVFFILSGFWVTRSFLNCKSIKEYALRRFIKIFPPYWGTVILFAVLLFFSGELSAAEYFLSGRFWKYLAVNAITLNFLQPSLPGVFLGLPMDGAVNGALWTIKIELGFYIILPFLMLILGKKSSHGGGV